MQEVDKRIPKDPKEMLGEARDGLIKCRELFILSTIMLLQKPIKKYQLLFWGNMWFNASCEEERITLELVAPAKLATGKYRTVPEVEDNVRKSGANFIKQVFRVRGDFAIKLATKIVDPHIQFTKDIQEEKGVPENPLYDVRDNLKSKRCRVPYGPTTKALRGKVAC